MPWRTSAWFWHSAQKGFLRAQIPQRRTLAGTASRDEPLAIQSSITGLGEKSCKTTVGQLARTTKTAAVSPGLSGSLRQCDPSAGWRPECEATVGRHMAVEIALRSFVSCAHSLDTLELLPWLDTGFPSLAVSSASASISARNACMHLCVTRHEVESNSFGLLPPSSTGLTASSLQSASRQSPRVPSTDGSAQNPTSCPKWQKSCQFKQPVGFWPPPSHPRRTHPLRTSDPGAAEPLV